MKKRKLVVLCCIAALVLSGCGKGETTVNTETAGSVQEAGESEAGENTAADTATGEKEYSEDEFVNVDWFLSTSPIPAPWNLDMPVLAEISKKTGVIMNADVPAQDADTKLNLLMVNGTLPDVISITNGTLYAELIESGQVWDLQEFFETYLPDARILNGSFPEDIKQKLIDRDGGWYALPSHIISNDNAEIWPVPDSTKEYWKGMDNSHQHTWVVNRQIMEEYGIEEESLLTEQGLLDAIKLIRDAGAVNQDGASVYPFMIHGADFWQWTTQAIDNLFGAMPVDADGNYQSVYYSEPFKAGYAFINRCYREGLLDPNIMTMDEATVVAMMNDDRVFCYMGGTAANAMVDRKIKDADGNDTNEYVYFCPGVVEWECGFTPAIGINRAVGTGWIQTFISKDCKEPEAVARFIDYLMFSEEGLTLWNYGIEGTDWVRNDKGLIERTKEGQEAYDNMATTGVGALWLFCNQNYDRMVSNITNNIDDVAAAVIGRDPATYIYDTSVFDLPSGYIESGSQYDITGIEVNNYVPQQLAKMVMAEDETQFEAFYQEFITQLDALGLKELDAYKNEAVQKNYETSGYSLKAVN